MKKNTKFYKVVYLCDRISPYHLSSFSEFAKLVDLTSIEFSLVDNVYKWKLIDGETNFNRVVLFSDKSISNQKTSEIKFRITAELNKIMPDVVVLGGWDSLVSLFAFQWCLNMNIPTVMASDSQLIDKPRVWLKEKLKYLLVKQATAGFVAGQSSSNYLNNLGIPKKKIFAGSSVVDNDYFMHGVIDAKNNEVSYRDRYNLPKNYFLVSGRWIHEKNFTNLILAYSKYLANVKSEFWYLVLLGDGPLTDEINNTITKLGISNKVICPGYIQYEDLPYYYGLAQVFILPSISETWGLVVNEAMASKLPVLVSYKCGCVLDLVKHGQNGFIIDPFNIENMANYMNIVSSQNYNREELGSKSLEIIQNWTKYTFSRSLFNAVVLSNQTGGTKLKFIEKLIFDLFVLFKRLH